MAPNDSTLYDPTRWVVGDVLRRQASRCGDKVCILTTDGAAITYSEAIHTANQVARLLTSLGARKGDTVAVLLTNGLSLCQAWFGISQLGAVHVAVNIDYKGLFLRHVLNNSGAEILITEAAFLDRVADIEAQLTSLKTIVIVGVSDPKHLNRFSMVDFMSKDAFAQTDVGSEVSYRDLACIMYTSGTTGPSKGVMMPHAHIYLFGLGTIDNMRVTSADTFYIVLPLFHANGMFMQLYASLIAGATAVIKHRFSASAWIHDVVRYQATITNSLGAVSAFVLAQPPTEVDRQHRLRAIGVAPNLPELDARLRERFGVDDVIGLYGMTEVNIPLYAEPGVSRPGSCGRLWDKYYELKITDPETDEEVPRRQTGEILVRPKQPYGFMVGYKDMPDKTVEAWRNFWFHTGDAAWMDEDGYVYFVDRIKDCIRRRGENISSYEIEQVIGQHQDVAEVAAVAVKSDIAGGEDEVKVVVVLKKDRQLEPQALIEYCEPRMPRFAVPRFVEFVDALPKTPTNKVRKNVLREAGVRSATWDRQTDGHR